MIREDNKDGGSGRRRKRMEELREMVGVGW